MDEQDDMLREIERMKKKQQILKMHPNKIYSSEKSGWYTSIDTPAGKNKIRKSTEAALLSEHRRENGKVKRTQKVY